MVETAKRILTKEKLDKQLTGQASTSQFINIREGTSRKVSFDTRDKLGDKIDKLTVMIGRLAAKDNNKIRSFKPQIHQSRGRGHNRGYSQRNYQNRNIMSNRSNNRDRGQFRQDGGRPRFEQGYNRNNFWVTLEVTAGKIAEGSIKMVIIEIVAIIEVEIGPERDHSQETIVATELDVQAVVD